MGLITIRIDGAALGASLQVWLRGMGSAASGGAVSAIAAALNDQHLRSGVDLLILAEIAAVGALIQGIAFMVRSPLQAGGSGWLATAITAAVGGLAAGLAPTLTDTHIWMEAVHTGEWGPIWSMAQTGMLVAMLGLFTKNQAAAVPSAVPVP